MVAHHMSVIAVRAETAPFRIPGLPEAVKDDMAETSAIAREALTEMRRLLGVLRGADADAERAPQPGMDRLEGLVAAVQGAGLTVDLHVEGDQRPCRRAWSCRPTGSCRRLSNALRHAPGAGVTVEVNYEPDRLRLRVHNDRRPSAATAPPARPGHGIVGMRSAPRCWAARWRRDRPATVATWSSRSSRWMPTTRSGHDHPPAACR